MPDDLETTLKRFGTLIDIEFSKPKDFSSETLVKRNFKEWFLKYNKNKQLGNVIKVWPEQNVIGAEYLKDLFVCSDDYICLMKFVEGTDPLMKIFQSNKRELKRL